MVSSSVPVLRDLITWYYIEGSMDTCLVVAVLQLYGFHELHVPVVLICHVCLASLLTS